MFALLSFISTVEMTAYGLIHGLVSPYLDINLGGVQSVEMYADLTCNNVVSDSKIYNRAADFYLFFLLF